jgi:hypothetical protein
MKRTKILNKERNIGRGKGYGARRGRRMRKFEDEK